MVGRGGGEEGEGLGGWAEAWHRCGGVGCVVLVKCLVVDGMEVECFMHVSGVSSRKVRMSGLAISMQCYSVTIERITHAANQR